MIQKQQQYSHDDVAALEAQIEQLKEAIVLLQTQLADMREQRDRWQSRAETGQPRRGVLTVKYLPTLRF